MSGRECVSGGLGEGTKLRFEMIDMNSANDDSR